MGIRMGWENLIHSWIRSHSKGVMILVNPRYKLGVIKSSKDKNGKLDNQQVVLVNRDLTIRQWRCP